MAEEQREWSPEQVRPGQVRRDVARRVKVTVEKIEDGSVHGYASDLAGAGTVAVSILSLAEFAKLPLVSDPKVPRWRVSAPLPVDQWATAIYDEIGTFVGGQTQTMAEGGMAGPRVQIDVVAPDAETAKERVAAIGGRVNRPVTPDEMTAEPAPG